MNNLPKLELIEDPNKKNDFIIFRHKFKGKTRTQLSKKRTKKYKTRKHKKVKTKSIFNIF
jgi:acetylornithine/succinyldiaminopimelate/putrescine aminotransferase